MNDPWLEARLKDPDFRARLNIILLIARICAIVSIVIGTVLLLILIVMEFAV